MLPIRLKLPEHFLEEEAKTLIVPADRKKVWAVELDLVFQLDSVCRQHGIKYFIDGGTALGAVRHGGFVPWDDDLDVIMPRKEYDRLCQVSNEFTAPYFFQTNKTDPGSARGHAQLRNSMTTGILKTEMIGEKAIYGFNQGVFIDIFPFDNLPDDAQERESFICELENLKNEIEGLRILPYALRSVMKGCLRPLFHLPFYHSLFVSLKARIAGRHALNDACDRLDQVAQRYADRPCKEVAPVAFMPRHKEVLPASFFDETIHLKFEFLDLPAMKQCKEALRINYGDWHKHVIGGNAHGGVFFDLDHPYTEYLKQ